MESRALKKYVRISRRKIARLAHECIGLRTGEAKMRLKVLPQKAADELYQTIHSAASNFLVKSPNTNVDEIFIRAIFVDNGPTMKRLMPRARGRSDRILKRSSHIKVVLSDEKVSSASKVPAGSKASQHKTKETGHGTKS